MPVSNNRFSYRLSTAIFIGFLVFWPISGSAQKRSPSFQPETSTPPSTERRTIGWVTGVYVAGFLPEGRWSNHVLAGHKAGGVYYPDDLTQFGPGIGGALECGLNWRLITLTLQADLSFLSTGPWERFAKQQGSNISASAIEGVISIITGVNLFDREPLSFDVRGGMGYFQATGWESNRNYRLSYSYDFLQPAFLLRAGIGLGYEVSRVTELTFIVDQIVGLPGVSYQSIGKTFPYLGLVLLLGVRIWPLEIERR